MKHLRRLLGLCLAALLFGVGQRLAPQLMQGFDPFLIFVLFQSLQRQPGWSMVEGSVAGLCHDALSGGLFGLHGIANTLVGFAAARLQQRLVIQRASQVALIAALGAALQQAILAILQSVFLARADGPDPLQAGGTMLVTGGACLALFALAHRWQGWRQSRRERLRRPTLEAR